MRYYLYILYSSSLKRYYVGISSDVKARLNSHNTGKKGWTVRGRPWRLVFDKSFASRQAAYRCEQWIKSQKSSALIKKIVSGEFELNLAE